MKESALQAIGNTPLVRLNKMTRGLGADVFIKLEFLNPTGSYKDRMALAMIEGAERQGLLKPGYTVVESTGGSTGTSLAFVCAVKGYKLKIVTSDAFSEEKRNTMRAFGAELTVIPSEGGKTTPDLVPRMIEVAEKMGNEPNTFRTDQFNNLNNPRGYNAIGEEMLAQLGDKIDAFVASFGTGGCAMGVAEVLKSKGKSTKVFLIEPTEAPLLSKGLKGSHHIEGIGVGFVPPLLRRGLYDKVLTVSTSEAQDSARRLAREEGIFAGASTGANVFGAIEVARRLGGSAKVVTIAVDSGLKYLSTELFRPPSA